MEKEILQITVLKGPKKGEILVCKPGSKLHIGRVMKGNDFSLRDPGISQKQLCLKFDPEASRWVISDLDSSNGTILNGSKIQPLVPVPISDHDVISIGEKTELGVRIVSLEENKENGDAYVRRVNPRRGVARSNARAGASVKEGVEEVESRVVVPVRGRRKKNNDEANSTRVLAEEEKMEKTDKSGGIQLRRNPRRGNSSKALKELDMNCTVEVGIKAKGAQKTRKERGKGKEAGVTEDKLVNRNDELLPETEDCDSDSDSVIMSNEGTGFKVIRRANSSKVTEEEKEEEDIGVKEDLEVNRKEVGDIENMTLGQWFDSMFIFLPKVIHDETEELIKILKEKANKYDELIEEGANV